LRQKYQIIHDSIRNKLKIREYAVIDKSLENTRTSMLRHKDYFLIYEEIYESDMIENSISNGISGVIMALRTPGLFPAASSASKIAESVISLFGSARGSSLELFFDDAAFSIQSLIVSADANTDFLVEGT
jgi:hypothetical protein